MLPFPNAAGADTCATHRYEEEDQVGHRTVQRGGQSRGSDASPFAHATMGKVDFVLLLIH